MWLYVVARQRHVIDEWCKAVGVSEQEDDALQGADDVDADSESVVFEDIVENTVAFESMKVSVCCKKLATLRVSCDVLDCCCRLVGRGRIWMRVCASVLMICWERSGWKDIKSCSVKSIR